LLAALAFGIGGKEWAAGVLVGISKIQSYIPDPQL
jgi:hypothetical protein